VNAVSTHPQRHVADSIHTPHFGKDFLKLPRSGKHLEHSGDREAEHHDEREEEDFDR
jgi:hypothetical protein